MGKSHTGNHGARQRGSTVSPGSFPEKKRTSRSDGYQLGGDVPWPQLGDGTEWRDGVRRVCHKYVPGWTGTLQSVEWCHPDGSYMAERTKTLKRKSGDVQVPRPGEWYGQVSWDEPDRLERPAARQKLAALALEP